MYLIDSHLHFDSFAEKGEVEEIIRTARDANVFTLIAIGGSENANTLAVSLANEYKGTVYATTGFDRDQAGEAFDESTLMNQLARSEVVGVGETGLDYHYNAETAIAQKKLFEQMLSAALQSQKPVVMHSRDAKEDTLGLLREFTEQWNSAGKSPGVLHCYTEDKTFAAALLDLGFMISFSGIITFKNAAPLREVATFIPRDRILIETDAPYLAPVPNRGKRNQPAYVTHVAKKLAEVLQITEEEVATFTTENTLRLFRIGKGKCPCDEPQEA